MGRQPKFPGTHLQEGQGHYIMPCRKGQYMTLSFHYRRLDGWIMPGTGYLRELQDHALQMEQELAKLREQLAVSGSRALQERAEKWAVEWQQKCIQVGELQKQLIEMESQKNAEISRLGHEIEYLEQQLEMYQKAERPARTPRGRDPKTGRFNTSIPASDKPSKAYLMHRQGFDTAQIAVKLGISGDSVKRYIRQEKAKRTYYSPNPDVDESSGSGGGYATESGG